MERQQDLVVDRVAQAAHQLLERHEVEDEPGLLVQSALNRHPGAVVVAVQPFAAMAGERDEVRRGEHEVILRNRDAELTAA